MKPRTGRRRRTVSRFGAVWIGFLATAALYAQTLDEARSLHVAGKLPEALDAYRRVAESVQHTDPSRAGTARNNACVILMNTGDLVGARDECSEALRLRRLVGDDRRTSRTLNNLGLVEQYLAEYRAAEEHFKEALSINVVLEDVRSQAINLANLGVLATQAGWFSKALDFHQQVLDAAREHRESAWAREQTRLARINQAVVLEKLGAYREALELYKLASVEQSEMDPRRQAGLSLNLGVVFRNLGDPIRALAAFREAAETYDRLGDTSALSNALLDMGLVYHLNLERPDEAEPAYREALRLAIESGNRSEEIRDLCYLGRFLLDQDRFDEAEATFRRSLLASRESGSAEGRWSSLEGLSRISMWRGDLQEAIEALHEAMAEIEQTRGALARSSLRGGFFGEKRPVYTAAVEVLYRMSIEVPDAGYAEQAFEVVQRAKARLLLDELGPVALDEAPLDVPGVASRLKGDLLLEYFIGDTELFVWEVASGRLKMRALGPSERILEKVGRAHRRLAEGRLPPGSAMRELAELLPPDLGGRLESIDLLRIAPDGRLHYLPFELLPLAESGGAPLVDSVDVSYLPSGSALGWLTRRPPRSDLTVVGFGAAVPIEGSSSGPNPARLLASQFDLANLPASAAELESIRRWMPGRSEIRTGEAATEEAFRRLVAEGPKVVHLASHAIVDEKHGRGAAILLAPGEASDGLLYPDEIATLEFPVDLTVLAACRTAVGSHDDGRALATLTGSFLAAGSSAVVATLWDVGDQATGAFMEQFYYQLQKGNAPAHALRLAKRRFLADERWRGRHAWAAFVLIGDADRLVAPSPAGAWPLGIALALALLVAYRLLRRRPRAVL